MTTFSLRHFSSPRALRGVQPKFLRSLLGRYADYFTARGVDVLGSADERLNYDAIAAVLMAPTEGTPADLVDDLYYVDDMATRDGMDALVEAVTRAGYELEGDIATPYDVAVQVRLRWPAIIERKHAEHALVHRRRTFEYLQARPGTESSFRSPTADGIREVEAFLSTRFHALKRGNACSVFVFERPDGVWILVRRGDPFKRDAAIEGGGASSVYYRPERYDVLRFDPERGELAVNADSNKKLVAVYREAMGALFFGDAHSFAAGYKYTLDPLHQDAEGALVCIDIDGIDSITLKEVQVYVGGPEGEVAIRRAKRDLLAALRRSGRSLPALGIVRATFSVKFTGVKEPRAVTIRSQNVASYTHDSDAAIVEEWLRRRGFIVAWTEAAHAAAA